MANLILGLIIGFISGFLLGLGILGAYKNNQQSLYKHPWEDKKKWEDKEHYDKDGNPSTKIHHSRFKN